MKYNFTIILFFLLGICSNIFSQDITLKGQLINIDEQEIPYAAIALKQDTIIINTIFTDEEGSFEFTNLNAQTYHIHYHSIGLKDRIDTIDIDKNFDLGKIKLQIDNSLMDEVVISEYKSLQQGGVEKIEFNITEDLRASNPTASELLEKLPMVNMDIEGTPSVIGKNGVVILVDGRAPKIQANNVATVLRMIPSDQIIKVELMRNPPLKYTRDNSAVINIITNRKPMQGYNANMRLNYDSFNNLRGGLSFNYKYYKWTVSTYMGKWNWFSKNKSTSKTNNLISLDKAFIDGTFNSEYLGEGLYGGVGIEYSFDPKTNLAIYLNMGTNDFKDESHSTSNFYNLERLLTQNAIQSNSSKNEHNRKGAWLSFDKQFKKPEHSLEISGYISMNNGDGYSNANYKYLDSKRNANNSQKSEDEYKNIEIEYYYPIDKHSNIEIGGEIYQSVEKNNYLDVYKDSIMNMSTMLQFDQLGNKNTIGQEFYLSYNRNWGKLTTTFGISYKNANYKINNSHYNLDKRFNSFKPQISLIYSFDQKSKVGLTYNYELSNPRSYQFIEYIDYSDQYNIYQFNKNLFGSPNHNIELNYSTYARNINIGFTTFYDYYDNPINTVLNVDSDGVQTRIRKNIGYNKKIGATGSISGTIIKKIRYNFNLSLAHQIRRGSAIVYKNTNYILGTTWNFPIKWGITSNFTTKYYSSSLIFDGNQDGYFSSSLSLRKMFLKKKMTLSISINDLFGDRITDTDIINNSFIIHRKNHYYSQKINVGVNYRFGNIKEIKTRGRERT